ncbi:MAG TPA: helix-turn-helix domain-containing protein [Pyrinomonadaceae bacterium]|jgi:predicted DNA-binding transcriptional regulator AlpA
MPAAADTLISLIRQIVREEIMTTTTAVPFVPEKTFYTEKEFCELVGISTTTAWRLRNQGKLRYSEVGRAVVYLQEHIIEFLKASERLNVGRTRAGARKV